MDILLLAATWMRGGYCFAGMNPDGNWIRPVLEGRQWKTLAYRTGENIRIGDVIRVSGRHDPNPPHTEDYIVSGIEKVRTLGHQKLIAFLNDHAENKAALDATLNRENRSLCLVQA